MKLTARQKEVLRDIESHGETWVRPMDIGGKDCSDHSRVLNQLAKLGFVETRRRNTLMGCLGSKRAGKVYRAVQPAAPASKE